MNLLDVSIFCVLLTCGVLPEFGRLILFLSTGLYFKTSPCSTDLSLTMELG